MVLAEKAGGRGCPGLISTGFHAFRGADLLPSQIRLCVPGFMARSVGKRWLQKQLELTDEEADSIIGTNRSVGRPNNRDMNH
jgi:hypothetical protein